ncbi:MAG: hypothetical protein IRZ05_08490 [Micromonosporaceae bacterium]|nr:hypothetical protein [Micromonosporaceae bacterium]
MSGAESYLTAADKLLTQLVPGARGTWPRACAWLIRLALETELAVFWAKSRHPEIGACRSRRAQLLLLPRYANRELARRATHAWAALSRASHHHSYELAPTATELRHLRDEVAAVVTGLRRLSPTTG